jgi:hypothetical protein
VVVARQAGERMRTSKSQVAFPRQRGFAPAQWMDHLEIHEAADVDDEVIGWLREAADRAS